MPRITGHRTTVNHEMQEANISRRISAPTSFSFAFDEGDGNEYPALPSFTATWNREARRYEITHFELRTLSDGSPISSQLLRQIPIGEITDTALNQVMMHLGRVRSNVAFGSFSDVVRQFQSKKHQLNAGRMSPEKLEWVATLFEMSSALGNKPTQEVSDQFGVSLRTASNWVRQARDSGELD